jgi:hypothetical protein
MKSNRILVLVSLLLLYITILLFKGETINKEVGVDYCFRIQLTVF